MAALPAAPPITGLQWKNWSNDAKSLLAVVSIDFTSYSSISVNPQGTYNNSDSQSAAGVNIDNLLNNQPIIVSVGVFTTVVPPFQKVTLPLTPGYPAMTFTGQTGIAVMQFFTGTYKGTDAGLNAYLAQQAANVATLTNGNIDAYLNSLKFNHNVQLPDGSDLNTQVIAGFYDVGSPLNGPVGPTATHYYLEVMTYSQSALWCRQILATLDDNENLRYQRWRVNAVWSPWVGIDNTYSGGSKNLLINGNFCWNARGYLSGANIVAGQYGHDRWMNLTGSAASYTYTQANNVENGTSHTIDTAITIPNGINIGQLIESAGVDGGNYTLSWQGSAQGFVTYFDGTNNYTLLPVGASGRTFVMPAGITPRVTFTNGTVSCAQLERGTIATAFERESLFATSSKCSRYFHAKTLTVGGSATLGRYRNYTQSADIVCLNYQLPFLMRRTPTVSAKVSINGGAAVAPDYILNTSSGQMLVLQVQAAPAGAYIDIISVVADADF